MCDARTPDIERELALADDALKRGEPEHARACALLASRMAVDVASLRLEAEALLRVSRADAMVSRLRDVHQATHRAAHLFEAGGDVRGEVRALVRFAKAASCLRHNEPALSAALLATKLAQSLADDALQSAAFDSLGIALIANGDFDRSDDALMQAATFARRAADRNAELRTRLNRCYGEIVRATVEQHLYGHPPDPQRLHDALTDCRRLQESDDLAAADREPTPEALMSFAECFWASWRGDCSGAAAHAARVAAGAARHGRTTWLRAIAMWAQGEVEQRAGATQQAESSIRCMIDLAISVEHEQLARTGYMLASRVLDAQGRSREALAELRALAQRDIEIRRKGHEHHERVAVWQLELRERSLQVRELEETSRRLEQWSLEDALTGLANRRQLEHALAEALEALCTCSEPFAIALIDVDRFKEINDRHSHVVGDLVLKTLADLLRRHVRQNDLPARLAGDEFVIVFRRANAKVARGVCERLQRAVAEFPWSTAVGPVRVGVSVGLAQASPADTIESLLGRSDQDMYRAKTAVGERDQPTDTGV